MKTIDFEIRTSEVSASNKKLVGYAVRWNSLSEVIWDEFREQFAPGAFKDSLASGSDVRALYEHNYTQLLGRTKSGTLVLSEDDTGLRFELTPPNTQLGNDVLELVERVVVLKDGMLVMDAPKAQALNNSRMQQQQQATGREWNNENQSA